VLHVERVRLKNFGVHAELDVTFSCGLVAVVGRNGSGKTTLIEAIHFNLTGQLRGGVRDEWIRQNIGDKDGVQVVVDYADETGSFSLQRAIKPNKVVLTAGSAEVVGATAVAQWLADRGIETAALARFVFPSQEEFAACVSASPTERAQSLQKLCDTAVAEKFYVAAGKSIEQLRAAADALTAFSSIDLDALKKELALAESGVKLEEGRIAAAAPKLLSKKRREALEHVVAERRRAKKDFKTWKELKAKRRAVGIEIAAMVEELEPLKAKSAELEALHDAANAAQDALRAEEIAHDKANEAWVTYEDALEAKEELEYKLKSIHPPKKPAYWKDRTVGETEQALLARDLEAATKKLKAAEKGICDSCGQPLPEAANLEEYKKRFCELDNQLNKVSAVVTKSFQYDQALETYKTDKAELELELAKCAVLTPPDFDKPEYRWFQDERQALEEKVNRTYGDWAKAANTADAAEESLRLRRSYLDGLAGRADQLVDGLKQAPKKAAAEAAEKRLTHDRQRRDRIAASKERLASHQQQAAVVRERLEQSASTKERLAAIGREISLQLELRTLFHRDGLPRDVAAENLALVRQALNQQLAELGVDFEVETGEDLSFTAKGQAARRLSGGQKMLLAAAFYRTWLEIGATGVSMLFLDEPTAWVDSVNLHGMRSYFERLAASIRGRTQIVVVTHHAELTSAFDQVITL
jgi:DNA repair exonuclease SbcCD ATPase subunit